jgi:iron complex outermembrane receptor protein
MNYPNRTAACLAILFGACTLVVRLAAQTSPAASDEVINLSPFSVTSDSEHGYIASESVTGSRVATAIKDLPFTINVFTSSFLNDFGIFDSSDNAFGYTSSAGAVDDASNNVIRGFPSQYTLRDGFFRIGPVDKVNIDRIEIIKGPNAAIYGETQPGGIINYISKRPKPTLKTSASVTIGSYKTERAEFSATGPILSKKTSFIASYADYERDFDVPFETYRKRVATFGIQHNYAHGDVYVLFDYILGDYHAQPQGVPYLFNSATGRYTGIAKNLDLLNENGPKGETTRDVYETTITDEHRLSDVFSTRVAANLYHKHRYTFNVGTSTQYDYLKGTLAKGTPNGDVIREDGGGVQADVLAQYPLFHGRIKNKTLLTFDMSDYYRIDTQKDLAAAFQTSPFWVKTIVIGQPINYSVPPYIPGFYPTASKDDRNRASIWGGLFRQQTAFWKNRLLLFGSLRYDHTDLHLMSRVPGDPGPFSGTSHAWSPSAGFNFKLTPNIALYGSRSNAFNANAQNQAVSNGSIQPNERDWGFDYGVKCNFLNDRLQFTAGSYYVLRKNVAETTAVILPNGIQKNINQFEGQQLARGVELDFTYQVTDDLSVLGGFGYTNSKIIADGINLPALGAEPRSVPSTNFGLASKYTLPGAFKGVSFNAGVIYVGRIHPNTPETGDGTPNSLGQDTTNDGRRDLTLPAYYVVNFGASYQFKLKKGSKLTNTIALNVKNVFNHAYIIQYRSTNEPGDLRGYYVTETIGF